MKQKFHEYYKLPESEIELLWESAFFVFDSNVLLNFYRYSESTIKEFIEIIEKITDKIWLPYQIGKEFHKDRLNVISKQSKIYAESSARIVEIQKEFSNEHRNPFLTKDLFTDLSNVLAQVMSELETKSKSFEDKLLSDEILDKLTALFQNKIGEDYSEEKLKDIFSTGKVRYSNKIPPGYKDEAKPENDRYGDLIIWNQLIDKAKNEKKPVVFITDDRKEDWWLENSGKTISPRPELRKEFFLLTNEQFYIYPPFKFLQYANKYLSASIKEDTIEEVKVLAPFKGTQSRSSFENDLLISIIVEIIPKKSNFQGFIDLLKSNGYEVYFEQIDSLKTKLFIPIPDIPDLKRRIKKKFISQIENYGLSLIEFKPNDND